MTNFLQSRAIRRGIAGALWVSQFATLAAAAARVPHVDAVFLSAPAATRVSADPSGEEWNVVPPIDAFVQRDPHEGAAPSERTEFRVAYDATTLFVKVRAYDRSPDKIVGYLTRRDADSPSDWIRVLIDSYHDRRTAYEFAVNPAGVKQDRYWFNDTNRDDSWDAVWDVTVSRDSGGWTAEFRIPFSQLRFNPGATNAFGFAVSRQIGRLNETSTWPLLSRSAPGYVSSFGELDGVNAVSSPRRLEVVPYTVANLTRQSTGGNPLVKNGALGGAAGVDLKYALTPGLTLTSTINPDFGQVEADPAVVNLTAFETFFAERRPFFVEGSGNFRLNLDCNDGSCTGLFYTRRIGRAPQVAGNLPSGDNIYTDSPAHTTILGAAKLTGRVGKYSIGVMQAVTREEFATVLDSGARSRSVVEPRSSYSVARVKREFDNQSSIGVMFTATGRQATADTAARLPGRAFTGGADFDLRFRKEYSLSGYWVASGLHGTPDSIDTIQDNSRHYFQRPGLESEHLDPSRTGLNGTAGSIGISKIAGEHVRFASNVDSKSPGFDINDVGYLRRADKRSMSNWLQIRSDTPTRWFRSRMINFNQWAAWNYDGDRLYGGGNINAHATFTNNWRIGAGFTREMRGFDDRMSRGGPGGLVEAPNEGWWYVDSDNRRRAALYLNGAMGSDGHGSWWRDIEPRVTVRPMSALELTAGVRLSHNVFDSQWIEKLTDGGRDRYVFGHLDQSTVAITSRVNYTIRPTLSVQLYAQPFVSAGDYSGFKELVDGRNPTYAARYAPYAFRFSPDDNPDFNYRSFRTTNVLRWEYKPGSTLFVVWQQAREDTLHTVNDFRYGRDLRGIFSVPPRNVFLIKFAYWLNY